MSEGHEHGGEAAGADARAGAGAAAERRELRRDDENNVITGVCAGLGRYTGVDPVVWRAAFAITALAGLAGLVLYVAAWMLMRDAQGGPAAFEQLLDRRIAPRSVLTLLAVGLAAATALSLVGGFSWSTLVLATPLILGLLVAHNRDVDLRAAFRDLPGDLRSEEPPPTTPAPAPAPAYYNPAQPWASAPGGPVDLAVVGERSGYGESDGSEDTRDTRDADDAEGREDAGRAPGHGCGRGAPLFSAALWALLAVTAAAVLIVQGIPESLWSAETAQTLFGPVTGPFYLAAVVITVGVFLVVGAWAGNPRGLIPLGVVSALALAVSVSTDLTDLRFGDTQWRPSSAAQAQEHTYRLTVGEGLLDLTGITDLETGDVVDVDAQVGVGSLVVVVPRDARVQVEGSARVGEVSAGDEAQSTGLLADLAHTLEPRETDGETPPPTLNIRAGSFAGSIEVNHGTP